MCVCVRLRVDMVGVRVASGDGGWEGGRGMVLSDNRHLPCPRAVVGVPVLTKSTCIATEAVIPGLP